MEEANKRRQMELDREREKFREEQERLKRQMEQIRERDRERDKQLQMERERSKERERQLEKERDKELERSLERAKETFRRTMPDSPGRSQVPPPEKPRQSMRSFGPMKESFEGYPRSRADLMRSPGRESLERLDKSLVYENKNQLRSIERSPRATKSVTALFKNPERSEDW